MWAAASAGGVGAGAIPALWPWVTIVRELAATRPQTAAAGADSANPALALAYSQLAALAATHGISRHRVDEVLDLVGLRDVARHRPAGFSLGMSQRLGIATGLLGEPAVVMLDEPVNGLDPEGIRWVRQFLRSLAAEGRTVFLSSHLMSEMAHGAATEQQVTVLVGRTMRHANHPTDIPGNPLAGRLTSSRGSRDTA